MNSKWSVCAMPGYKCLLSCKAPVLAFTASQNTAELPTALELSPMCSDHTEEASEKTPR